MPGYGPPFMISERVTFHFHICAWKDFRFCHLLRWNSHWIHGSIKPLIHMLSQYHWNRSVWNLLSLFLENPWLLFLPYYVPGIFQWNQFLRPLFFGEKAWISSLMIWFMNRSRAISVIFLSKSSIVSSSLGCLWNYLLILHETFLILKLAAGISQTFG